jgi:hypothetical protein
MPLWNKRSKWAFAVAGTTSVYFATAIWLDRSYVSPVPKGKIVIRVKPPFEQYGHASIFRGLGEMDALADDEHVENDTRSPVLLYEGFVQLGPAHGNFRDIMDLGSGRYSHWRKDGFIFSTSDNSDPTTNGRKYWAVLPD